jgi:hypothetical protein
VHRLLAGAAHLDVNVNSPLVSEPIRLQGNCAGQVCAGRNIDDAASRASGSVDGPLKGLRVQRDAIRPGVELNHVVNGERILRRAGGGVAALGVGDRGRYRQQSERATGNSYESPARRFIDIPAHSVHSKFRNEVFIEEAADIKRRESAEEMQGRTLCPKMSLYERYELSYVKVLCPVS